MSSIRLSALGGVVGLGLTGLALAQAPAESQSAPAESQSVPIRQSAQPPSPISTGAAGGAGEAEGEQETPAAVGQEQQTAAAQAAEARTADMVAVFEERSLLGAGGKFTIEPSLSYSHNSSTLVAVEGFTIIPALVVGLINVSQVQRDTFVGAVGFRYAFHNRLQLSLKLPYVQTKESIRERQAFDGSPVDIVNNSDGDGLGDIEGAIQYQFNAGQPPFFTGSLRFKSHTGTSPFQIERRTLKDQNGKELGFVFAEQPTGSGFWAVQPGLSMVYPSDPAVLYWNISYLWNIERDWGAKYGWTIDPGDAVGFSFGLGFAINERTSFSLGYDHSTINRTKVEGAASKVDATFDRYQVGSFLIGINQSLSNKHQLGISLGLGVTEQAPDVQLTVRAPFSF